MENYTLEEYLADRRGILSSLRVWGKMTKKEREYFDTSQTEIQIEQRLRYFRNKYL